MVSREMIAFAYMRGSIKRLHAQIGQAEVQAKAAYGVGYVPQPPGATGAAWRISARARAHEATVGRALFAFPEGLAGVSPTSVKLCQPRPLGEYKSRSGSRSLLVDRRNTKEERSHFLSGRRSSDVARGRANQSNPLIGNYFWK